MPESLLARLFHLSSKGKLIVGELSMETPKGPTIEINVKAMVQELLEKFKIPDIEIKTKILDPNDLGIEKRMLQ